MAFDQVLNGILDGAGQGFLASKSDFGRSKEGNDDQADHQFLKISHLFLVMVGLSQKRDLDLSKQDNY